jgi:hypothetical protein
MPNKPDGKEENNMAPIDTRYAKYWHVMNSPNSYSVVDDIMLLQSNRIVTTYTGIE